MKNWDKVAKELKRKNRVKLEKTLRDNLNWPDEAIELVMKQRFKTIENACEDLKRKNFDISKYIIIHCVSGDVKDYGYWLHTHGMFIFDKPEIEIFGVPKQQVKEVAGVLNDIATYLIEETEIGNGDTMEIGDKEYLMKFELCADDAGNPCLAIVDFRYKGKEMFTVCTRAAAIIHFKNHAPPEIIEQLRGETTKDRNIRTFLQTPFDRLEQLNNDYSEQERLFQHGMIKLVDLVDSIELAKISKRKAEQYQKERRSVRQIFLENEENVKSLSIVIPVRKRRAILFENLDSILRQTFVKYHPEKVEILIIQDGDAEDKSKNPICKELFRKLQLFPQTVKFRLFKLSENKGRSTARNVGIYYGSHDIVFFVDSSMILEQNFLMEHMLRHHRIPKIALLGFKENIKLEKYKDNIKGISNNCFLPNYRKDLKWVHILKRGEADFTFKGYPYITGDKIYYMNLTNNFKNLSGTDVIGYRTLPTFFQTNIVSVPLHAVKQVGGFEGRFNSLWGFEDSYLGALLFAKGIKFVPCPSSLAFKIEHDEEKTKLFDIKRHRHQFDELLHKKDINSYCEELLRRKIDELERQNILKEVKNNKNR